MSSWWKLCSRKLFFCHYFHRDDIHFHFFYFPLVSEKSFQEHYFHRGKKESSGILTTQNLNNYEAPLLLNQVMIQSPA